jgi:hypothetical protein
MPKTESKTRGKGKATKADSGKKKKGKSRDLSFAAVY